MMFFTVLSCLVAIVLAKVLAAVHKSQRLRDVPGLFGGGFWPLGRILPPHERWNVQPVLVWEDKGKAYRKFGLNAYAIKSLWTGHSTVVISDVEAVKQITQKPELFIKPTKLYNTASYYGPSLLSTNGEVWKKHRQVAGPAFGTGFDKSMWIETIRVVDEWFERLPVANQHKQHIVDVSDALLSTTLMIISAAGFGRVISWPDQEEEVPAHHAMSWLDSLNGMFKFLIPRGVLADWVFKLPIARLRRIDGYFTSFERHIFEMIDERRTMGDQGHEKEDLFSCLIRASDAEAGTAKLNRQELLADIHVFLLAGHETTAHALMAAFMLCVLHPEHQDTIAREAKEAFGEVGEGVEFEAYGKLRFTTAFFMENLRLLPSVNAIPKLVVRDTSIVVHKPTIKSGEEPIPVTIPLPAGTNLRLDATAMALDPAYWGDDALEFKPTRFIDEGEYKWPREAYMIFNAGQRVCIGRQAALVEATAFLARTVAKFRIEAPAADAEAWKARAGESEMDRRQRIYNPSHGITLTPCSPLNIALVPRGE